MTTIAPVEVPGFEFTKLPYADLLTRFRSIAGYTEEALGTSFGGHPIYGYRLNGGIGKPVILIQANIHGLHEWRTCYWVSEFMRLIADPTLSPDPAMFTRLTDQFAFYFLPACNPDGYIGNVYQNGNGVNLNRNFGYTWEAGPSDPAHAQYRGAAPFSEPETQIVRDKVLEIKPVGYISCHSWGGATGLTTGPPVMVDYVQQTRDILQATKDVLGLGEDSYPISSAQGGLDTNWVSKQADIYGAPVFALVMESGDQVPEPEQARMGMTGLLAFCLMVEARADGDEPAHKRRDLFSRQYLLI